MAGLTIVLVATVCSSGRQPTIDPVETWVVENVGDPYDGLCPPDVVARPLSERLCSQDRGQAPEGHVYWLVRLGAGEPSWALLVDEGTRSVIASHRFGPLGSDDDQPDWARRSPGH